jgi:hypothetical protein
MHDILGDQLNGHAVSRVDLDLPWCELEHTGFDADVLVGGGRRMQGQWRKYRQQRQSGQGEDPVRRWA